MRQDEPAGRGDGASFNDTHSVERDETRAATPSPMTWDGFNDTHSVERDETRLLGRLISRKKSCALRGLAPIAVRQVQEHLGACS